MAKKPVIIYDYVNTTAWVDKGDEDYSAKNTESRRFKSNRQARSYAFKLANKYKAPVYDKYYGEYIGKYAKPMKKVTIKPKANLGKLFKIPKMKMAKMKMPRRKKINVLGIKL